MRSASREHAVDDWPFLILVAVIARDEKAGSDRIEIANQPPDRRLNVRLDY